MIVVVIKKEKKNVWLAEEKEVQGRKKKETFWRREIFGQWRRRTRGKGIKIFGKEKGRNIWRWKLFGRQKKIRMENEKEKHILEKEKLFRTRGGRVERH